MERKQDEEMETKEKKERKYPNKDQTEVRGEGLGRISRGKGNVGPRKKKMVDKIKG